MGFSLPKNWQGRGKHTAKKYLKKIIEPAGENKYAGTAGIRT
jgi:hypothetical protein